MEPLARVVRKSSGVNLGSSGLIATYLHHDPFDRALLAQAQAEVLTLVTRDETIHRYPSVKCVW